MSNIIADILEYKGISAYRLAKDLGESNAKIYTLMKQDNLVRLDFHFLKALYEYSGWTPEEFLNHLFKAENEA